MIQERTISSQPIHAQSASAAIRSSSSPIRYSRACHTSGVFSHSEIPLREPRPTLRCVRCTFTLTSASICRLDKQVRNQLGTRSPIRHKSAPTDHSPSRPPVNETLYHWGTEKNSFRKRKCNSQTIKRDNEFCHIEAEKGNG